VKLMRNVLVSQPGPPRLIFRIAMIAGCLFICTELIVVLHVSPANKPVLVILAVLPALAVVSFESIAQLRARRRRILAEQAETEEAKTKQAETEQIQRVLTELANVQETVAVACAKAIQPHAERIGVLSDEISKLKQQIALLDMHITGQSPKENAPEASIEAVRRAVASARALQTFGRRGSEQYANFAPPILDAEIRFFASQTGKVAFAHEVEALITSGKSAEEIAAEIKFTLKEVSTMLEELRKEYKVETNEQLINALRRGEPQAR
jgi:DNA-binding NarL/FixJ family response regulator